ncbi:MAG TPA: nucleotidyltransferase family protein [Pyrinomonadaceae bacterium]|nr:nucleotidyltransferase family protein [Pyrinomonadaceae bacterium]
MTKPGDHREPSIFGLILAAGQSIRMGAFKPLLPFGNITVVENCIQNLRDGGADEIIVVTGAGERADQLRNKLGASSALIAVNPNAKSEMSDSIACGMHLVSEAAGAVLITPVDHPAVPPNVVARLIDEWRQGSRLVKPTWNGRGGHPVLIDLMFRDALVHLEADGGLSGFFKSHQAEVTRLPVDSNYIARDMDTWDDYRSLHEEVFGFGPKKQPINEARATADRTSDETN